MEKIRKALLEETNYRCGSCMRNITPRVYYLDDGPDKNPIHDYVIYNYEKKEEQKFYNISDRCHIIPNAEVKDGYNDFYNLIALCKICHHEVDKAKMLDITELKRLKLHWMIASGRFTKIEFDCLFDLYDKKDCYHIREIIIPNETYSQRITEFFNKERYDFARLNKIADIYWLYSGSRFILLNPSQDYSQGVVMMHLGLKENDFKLMKIECTSFAIILDNQYDLKFFEGLINNDFVENKLIIGTENNDGKIMCALILKNNGNDFCEKFKDVYKNNHTSEKK